MAGPTTRAAVAGLAVTVLFVVGCSKDHAPDAAGLADDLIEETDGALDQEQADCVAAGLVTSFGDDAFETVLDAADGSGDADDIRIEVIDIFASCDALEAVVVEP